MPFFFRIKDQEDEIRQLREENETIRQQAIAQKRLTNTGPQLAPKGLTRPISG